MTDRHRGLIDELSGPVTPRLAKTSARPGSGSFDVRRALDRAASDLACAAAPPAKLGPGSEERDRWNAPALARFKLSCDTLGQLSWSWDRIAKYLGCSRTHVLRLYRGHGRPPAYMLDRLDDLPELACLPARMRVEQLRKVV